MVAETNLDQWYNVMGHKDDEESDFEGFALKDTVKDEESDVLTMKTFLVSLIFVLF